MNDHSLFATTRFLALIVGVCLIGSVPLSGWIQSAGAVEPTVYDSSSSTSYSEVGGGWQQWDGGGHDGNQRYHEAGSDGAAATWQITSLSAGDYEVGATWVEGSSEASSAPWEIYDGTTLITTVFVDNRQAPQGPVINGRPFQTLATVAITSGTLKVVAHETPTGQVAVDAISVAAVSAPPPPTADLNWINGGLSNQPISVNTGESFNVTRTYTVSGADIGTAFNIAYYSSTDQTIGNSDDAAIGTETINSQADRTQGSHSGTSPSFQISSAGTYYLIARLDASSSVAETNEGNNLVLSETALTVISPPPPPGATVYDSSSSTNYSEVGGGWQQWDGGGHDGNQRYHEAGSDGAAATWQITSLSAGDYEVGATWVEGSSEASSAPWEIYDGTTLITTVFVDNRQAPQGPVINGRPFQTLATVAITSGTLKVVAHETPTGQVAVDAISVAAVSAPPPPTADLNWINGGLSNQPISVNTGESFNITRTYTVSGADIGTAFNIAYYSSTDQTIGNSDDAAIGTETINSQADRTQGSHSGTSPSFQISSAGTYYLIARLDASSSVAETNEGNNLVLSETALTVISPPPPPGATVYDSSSSTNYSEVGGGWQQWDGGGHDGNQRYHEAGSDGAAATWQITSLSAGDYEVGATWVEGSSEASSAPWEIYDGTTLITTVFVDNRQAPQGPVINGRPFQTLATVAITSGTLKVVAHETPTGQVAVDAISVAAVSAPPPPTADLNWINGGLSNQPISVNTGESFNITRTYTVSGADIGTAFNIAYYSSTDQTIGNSDDAAIGTETINSQADRTQGSHSGTSPSFQISSAGTYYLIARLDASSSVAETNEGNNLVLSETALTVIGVPPPQGAIIYDEFDDSAGVNLVSHAPNVAPENSSWQVDGGAEYILGGDGTVQQQSESTDETIGGSAFIDAGVSDAFMVVVLRTPPAPFFRMITGMKFRADSPQSFNDLEFYRGTGVLGVYSKLASTDFVDEVVEPFDMQPDTDYTYKVWVRGSQIVAQVGTHVLVCDTADPGLLGTMVGLFEHREFGSASSVYKSFQVFPWDHEPLPDLESRLIDTFGGTGPLSAHSPDRAVIASSWVSSDSMAVNNGSVSSDTSNNQAYFDNGQANVIVTVTGHLGALDETSYIGAMGRRTASGQYIEARLSGDGKVTLLEHDPSMRVIDAGSWAPDTNSHTVRLVIKTSTYFETIEVYLDDVLVASEVRGLSLLSVGGETIRNATKHGFTLGTPLDIINRIQVDLIRW